MRVVGSYEEEDFSDEESEDDFLDEEYEDDFSEEETEDQAEAHKMVHQRDY